MMPDDLWKPLSDHEVRSLVAYLASPEQVPALLTAENAPNFFNARDLTGWLGTPNCGASKRARSSGRPRDLHEMSSCAAKSRPMIFV